MSTLSDDEWRAVEHAYLHDAETVVQIAARFGVAPATINNRRDKYNWKPRRARAVRFPNGNPAERAALKADVVARFYRLIRLKLEHMEEDMARSTERTPTDHERETRALGTLIRNYEKVAGIEQESGKDDDKRTTDGRESHAEAEAVRREFAERLVRLRKTGPDDGE